MAQITLNSTGVASSGSLALQSNGTTTAVTIDASQNVGIGTTPSAWGTGNGILQLGNSSVWGATSSAVAHFSNNTYFDGTNYKAILTGSATDHYQIAGTYVWRYANSLTAGGTISSWIEAMRIDASGNVGIGTSSPAFKLDVSGGIVRMTSGASTADLLMVDTGTTSGNVRLRSESNAMKFITGGGVSATIDSSGNLLVGKTATGISTAGVQLESTGTMAATRSGGVCGIFNRLTNDTDLVWFQQDNSTEGTISVSGTTVSYNGGHLSRYAQTTTAKDDSLVKGTVLSNLDAMNVYTDAEGNPVDNEQLNKVKVSDVEGDVNVAGVFVNWSHDDAHNVDEINMAMTGDMIIRIAQGVTVQRGDLLMSAGNGTAKPQGDDIVRSKTIAKVTSTHVTCTYADGSFCVPCVLMAC